MATSAGQKVTVDEASATTYQKGTSPASASAITTGESVLVGTPAAGQRADCYLSADPWALLLVLYGRSGPLKPALSGRILAWGHRPWLAFTLPTLFRKP